MALGTGTEREHQERGKGCRQHPRRAPPAPRFCQQALSSSLPRARGAASLAQRSTHPVAHQPEEGWGLGLGAPGTGTGTELASPQRPFPDSAVCPPGLMGKMISPPWVSI